MRSANFGRKQRWRACDGWYSSRNKRNTFIYLWDCTGKSPPLNRLKSSAEGQATWLTQSFWNLSLVMLFRGGNKAPISGGFRGADLDVGGFYPKVAWREQKHGIPKGTVPNWCLLTSAFMHDCSHSIPLFKYEHTDNSQKGESERMSIIRDLKSKYQTARNQCGRKGGTQYLRDDLRGRVGRYQDRRGDPNMAENHRQ